MSLTGSVDVEQYERTRIVLEAPFGVQWSAGDSSFHEDVDIRQDDATAIRLATYDHPKDVCLSTYDSLVMTSSTRSV